MTGTALRCRGAASTCKHVQSKRRRTDQEGQRSSHPCRPRYPAHRKAGPQQPTVAAGARTPLGTEDALPAGPAVGIPMRPLPTACPAIPLRSPAMIESASGGVAARSEDDLGAEGGRCGPEDGALLLPAAEGA